MALKVPRGLAPPPVHRSDSSPATAPRWLGTSRPPLSLSLGPAMSISSSELLYRLLPLAEEHCFLGAFGYSTRFLRSFRALFSRQLLRHALENLLRSGARLSSKPPASPHPLSEFHVGLLKLHSFPSSLVVCPFNQIAQWQGISFVHCYIPSPVNRRHFHLLNEGMNG